MREVSLEIPEGVNVVENQKKLLINFKHMRYQIPIKYFILDITDKLLTFKYPKRLEKINWPKITTYKKLIEKYSRGPKFRYVLEFSYSHFPINQQVDPVAKTLKISNFLGIKKEFTFNFRSIDSIEKKDKNIIITSYNDILTGAEINKVKNIRYKTIQKKLDRRVFIDGFTVIKEQL